MGRKRKTSNLSRKTRTAKRLQLKRRLENQEERMQRLEYMRNRVANKRANETVEEHESRIKKNRIRVASKREIISRRLKSNRLNEIINRIGSKGVKKEPLMENCKEEAEDEVMTDDSSSRGLEPEQIDRMLDIELICVDEQDDRSEQ